MSLLGAAFTRDGFLPAAFNTEGGVKGLMYAQGNVARGGATRGGYHSPKVFVSVGGVHRANGKSVASYVMEDLSISETRSATPNRASFKAHGWEVTNGMEVIATLGSMNRIRRIFGGTVLSARQSGYKDFPTFHADCIDWNWLLDGAPVYGHFTGTYDEIALELMSTYAPVDFTVRQVELGLPTVDGGITFTGVKLSAALKRLEKRGANLGLVQFIDYNKDLYFRVTPSAVLTNPRPVVVGLESLKKFNVSRDLSQIANRVPFEGGGANALTEVSIGETILPLESAPEWWYGDVGGVVISGPQKITYTARVEGGGGSIVGPGVSPSSAPIAALAAGSGVDSGSHVIAFVWKTASGRTLPGATATIIVGLVSAPSAAVMAGTPTSGGSVDAGSHTYVPVFRTAAGSTTPGPVSNAVVASLQANPTATMSHYSDDSAGSLNQGAEYKWAYTFKRSSDGAETLPSSVVTYTVPVGKNRVFLRTTATGQLSVPAGYTVQWYRTANSADPGYPQLKRLTPVSWDGEYMGDGDGNDANLGANAPTVNATAYGTIAVTGIPISADTLVTNVDLYRAFNGGTAKYAFTVTNGTTSASDTLANSGRGADVPSSNTAVANQIAVSGIAVGPSGTTDRELYMSPVGGGARKLALTIANNTATTGTITISDATLASQLAEPVTDTSGLTQPAGQVLPGATSIITAGTAPFRSAGGWAFTGTQPGIRYTGFTGNTLTGVPASGVGSITQPINYNTTIAAAPCLIGIPAPAFARDAFLPAAFNTGDGSILYTIPKGQSVNLFVTVEDTDAQAGLQVLLDADDPVVRECPPLQDRRLKRDEAITRATAFLTARAYPAVAVGPYLSKDMNNRAGLEVNINIAEWNVNDDFKLQSVNISNFTQAIAPDYMVQASDELFDVADILSREP